MPGDEQPNWQKWSFVINLITLLWDLITKA